MLAANALDNLSFLTMAVLAVVGGAVVGALLTMLSVWFVSKYFFKRQLPWGPRKLLRILGAIAGALFVAGFLHFGGGGWGPFGGDGTGTGDGAGKSAAPASEPTKDPSTTANPATPAPTADRIRIIILGGQLVRGRAFYRIEGQRTACELKDVQEFIKNRRAQAGHPITTVDVLVYQDSAGYNTEQVKQLMNWLTESGLTPNQVRLPSDIPAQ